MRDVKKFFLRFLEVELDDLKEDLDLLAEQCRRHSSGDRPTEHVVMANLALFNKELLGVGKFSQLIHSVKTEEYETLDEMVQALKKMFAERIAKCDLPPAVRLYIDRKIDKVVKYMRTEHM
ncbi:MAG: hypothetical protein EOM20_19300 [Spartobacteria bacterium]|nr:hypothetical protein [Spartobacteria bacterium]